MNGTPRCCSCTFTNGSRAILTGLSNSSDNQVSVLKLLPKRFGEPFRGERFSWRVLRLYLREELERNSLALAADKRARLLQGVQNANWLSCLRDGFGAGV